ncbi:hypothetical protein EVAR_89978_1 [Eumeta japonica]|uniref:Uncharacterized protein n=1 Tax=Eumeta variegata TaxID=151549 RepID=A0A4C2A816_EUMVA|nr:hypothetical protein EVAR_89978_1 [Eumeta japonica]
MSRRFVPISAAGLQGEEPLVDRIMGKSRNWIRNFGIRIGSEDRGASGSEGKRTRRRRAWSKLACALVVRGRNPDRSGLPRIFQPRAACLAGRCRRFGKTERAFGRRGPLRPFNGQLKNWHGQGNPTV